MPFLKNPKWEMFAQEISRGVPINDAYVMSGFRYNDGNSSKLYRNPDVQSRINEIKLRASYRTEVKIKDVMEELAKIGFANIMDYVRIDENGQPVTDFSNISREKAAAIIEINVEEIMALPGRPSIKKTKFKLADKKGALVDMGKHLGMFKEQVDVSVNSVPIVSRSSADLKKELLANLIDWGYVPAATTTTDAQQTITGVVPSPIPEANAEGSESVN